MFNSSRAVVVIPAFNEERWIADVIEAAQTADPSLIDTERVIVVDNNSTDRTAEIARFMGAQVTDCTEQGKSPAMAAGAEVAKKLGAKTLTFLDADLINLTGSHVDQLTEPVVTDQALMTIGYLGGRNWLAKLIYKRWGMFAGQRSVSTDVWDSLTDWDLRSFRAEAAMNSVLRNSNRGKRIQRMELEGVYHIGKREKYSSGYRVAERYTRVQLSAVLGLLSRSRME